MDVDPSSTKIIASEVLSTEQSSEVTKKGSYNQQENTQLSETSQPALQNVIPQPVSQEVPPQPVSQEVPPQPVSQEISSRPISQETSSAPIVQEVALQPTVQREVNSFGELQETNQPASSQTSSSQEVSLSVLEARCKRFGIPFNPEAHKQLSSTQISVFALLVLVTHRGKVGSRNEGNVLE